MAYYMATCGAPHHRVPPFGRALHYTLYARASGEGHVPLPANALVCMCSNTNLGRAAATRVRAAPRVVEVYTTFLKQPQGRLLGGAY